MCFITRLVLADTVSRHQATSTSPCFLKMLYYAHLLSFPDSNCCWNCCTSKYSWIYTRKSKYITYNYYMHIRQTLWQLFFHLSWNTKSDVYMYFDVGKCEYDMYEYVKLGTTYWNSKWYAFCHMYWLLVLVYIYCEGYWCQHYIYEYT